MTRPTIVVCDDDPERVNDWASDISGIDEVAEQYEVLPLKPVQFAAAFQALKARKAAMSLGEPQATDDAATMIDDATIVIVDYDLTPRPEGLQTVDEDAETVREHLDGEFGDNFAYLARCYSTVDYLVLVNNGPRTSTFDLTMTMFNDSIADLNVAASDLERRELWLGRSDGQTFRPWHWPALVDAPQRLMSLAAEIDLGAPVLTFLGLAGEEVLDALTAEQTDPLMPRRGQEADPQSITFNEIIDDTGLGLTGRSDKQTSEDVRRRIAASAALRWLERTILPAQNVLIDAVHLVERFPALLNVGDADATRMLITDLRRRDETLGQLLQLTDALAGASRWLSRPVWFASTANREARRAGPRPQGTSQIFCEDVSTFREAATATEYTSAVAGPYRQRFVARLPAEADIDYRPRNRMLM